MIIMPIALQNGIHKWLLSTEQYKALAIGTPRKSDKSKPKSVNLSPRGEKEK
jgi:hypothetical protein